MSSIEGAGLRQSGRVKLRAARTLDLAISEAATALSRCLAAGRRACIAGNGGSAADAQHFAAEFTGKFRNDRQPLPVLALTTDTSALTSIGNDYGFEEVFSRQLTAFGQPGDVFLALSTSGSSPNVVHAARAARERGITVISLTGASGGELATMSNIHVRVPSGVTAWIQECTMSVLHTLCDLVEQSLGLAPPLSGQLGVSPSVAEVATAREAWRMQGLTVVTTNGCFDILHAGHLASFGMAADLGDVLVVLINSDDSVRALKGAGRPFNDQRSRAALLAALEPVDHVLVFDDADPSSALELIQPDIHCKGEDYQEQALPMPEAGVVARYGGRVEFLPRVHGLSTTGLIQLADLERSSRRD